MTPAYVEGTVTPMMGAWFDRDADSTIAAMSTRPGPTSIAKSAAGPRPDQGPAQPAFEIVAPRGTSLPVIAHIPHASTVIPDQVRPELIIDDEELAEELVRSTDWYTDDLFASLHDHGATTFLNRLSRLVFDPERFLDDAREPAATRGQGVVYTHGTQRQRLRRDSAALRTQRIDTLYQPYHAALDATVGALLKSEGRCTIIDCHSFPSRPLPSELDQTIERPDICIGTDPTHTPPELAVALTQAFANEGFRVQRDTPFAGTFVPSGYYEREPRVHSVMIELRRGLYLDEQTARRSGDYAAVEAAIGRALLNAGLFQDRHTD